MLLKNKRVFIVEDNLQNKAIMQMLLEYNGARVACERWGTNTIAIMEKFMPVDIVLLDLMFPNNITGYDVFNDIRAVPAFDHIPIVAVSASEPSVAVPETRRRGFAGFIPKPV